MIYQGFPGDALLIGIGATAVMDAVAALRARLFGTAGLDYALVGRWAIWLTQGRLRHDPIQKTPARRFERPLGWAVHYGIGITFVCLLLAVAGPGWAARPTLGPALLTGALTVAAPFLVMQPSFGFGFAASKAPSPWAARGRSLMTHLTFGLGIYLAALALLAMRGAIGGV